MRLATLRWRRVTRFNNNNAGCQSRCQLAVAVQDRQDVIDGSGPLEPKMRYCVFEHGMSHTART